jgi:hypothetical protein
MIGNTNPVSYLERLFPKDGRTSDAALLDALLRHYPAMLYPNDVAKQLKSEELTITNKYNELSLRNLCTKNDAGAFQLSNYNIEKIGNLYLPNRRLLGFRFHTPKATLDGWDSIVYFYLRGDMQKLAELGTSKYYLNYVKAYNEVDGGWGKTNLGKANITNHFVYSVMLRTITQTAHAFQNNEKIPELPHGLLGNYWQKRAFKQYEKEGLPKQATIALKLKEEKPMEWLNYLAQANQYYLSCL